MQFAMYLVDNGIITCEEFFEALKLQIHSRPQLGALAIETRRLTVRQVFSILRNQCDQPNEMFGEIAVARGYLTEADLARLLAEQAARARPLLDVLVENDFISGEVADRHYAEYRRCLTQAEPGLATAGA